MIHENEARNRKHTPPLNSVQLGVQMRFTIGQIPVTCSSTPAAIRINPAITNFFTGIFGAAARNHSPARNPSKIVPSVGMKLSVRYPPPLSTNREARGRIFKNHTSNAWPRLLFLFQCEAKPVKLYGQLFGTPTAAQSKFAPGAG